MAMSPAERVRLLDAAMRSGDPQACLDGVHLAFDEAGRADDALAAMVLRALIRSGEVEMPMHMRAPWCGRRAAPGHRPSRPT